MQQPTFRIWLRSDMKADIGYAPMIVVVGAKAHKLALHKDQAGDWAVSDPKSGMPVIRKVPAPLLAPSSKIKKPGIDLVMTAAKREVELLIKRIGSDAFNEAMNNPPPF